MTIKSIYVVEGTDFGKSITQWVEDTSIEAIPIEQKNNELLDVIDAVVIFHENHNFSKEDEETHAFLVENNKPGYKVDINGTLAATNSNFTMWLERNKPNSLFILGQSAITKNPNLKRFLESMES